MECYRILKNKKIIVLILFLLVLNGFLFSKEQWKWSSYTEFQHEKEFSLHLLQSIKRYDIKEGIDFLNHYATDKDNEKMLIARLHNQLSYIYNYKSEVEKIQQNAKQLKVASILGEGNTKYIEESIQATTDAYGALKEQDLEVGNDNVINAMVSYQTVGYINLIIMLIFIGQMVCDKKQGLDKITYATPNGRLILALKRCGILVATALFSVAMNMGIMLVLSIYFYGNYVDFGRNIQSIPMFQNFVYPLSIWQFLLLYYIVWVLVLTLLSFLIWFVLIVVKNFNIAVLLLSMIGFVEYYFSSTILVQSNWKLLKYINVVEYFKVSGYLLKYYNLDICNHAVNRFSFILVGVIILLLFFGTLSCVCFSNIRSCRNEDGIIEHYIQRIKDFGRKFQGFFGSFGTECYKIVVICRGILIMAILIFAVLEMNTEKQMNYNDAEQYVNQFYKSFTGKIDQQVFEFIESEYNGIEQAQKNYKEIYEQYKKGKADKVKLFEAEFRVESYKGANQGLPIIEHNIQRLEKIKQGTNIDGWLLNERAYNKWLGEDSNRIHIMLVIISLMAVLLLFSGNTWLEKKSNMIFLLRGSKNGRKHLLIKKILAVSIITIVVISIFYGCEIGYIKNQFGITGLRAPVQSITVLQEIPYNISIMDYLIGTHIIRCVFYLFLAWLVFFISMYLSQKASMGLLMLLLIVPIIMEHFNVPIISYVSLFSILQVDPMIIDQENVIKNIIKICILFLLTAIVTVKNSNRWCHT